jgi:radical SAM protein with 4Fe4S-binding SPASM domain
MIVIYITNECNRSCPRCYWQSIRSGKMDSRTVSQVAWWIADTCYSQRVQALNLGFLGGEPFGNPEMLFMLHDSVRRLRPPFTGDYADAATTVYTNGDPLTPALFREIKTRRILLRFNPTYDDLDTVERKAVAIKSALGGCSLSVALDEMNLMRLPELAHLVVKHGFQIRTNRLYDGGAILGYVQAYKEQMRRMFEIFLDAGKPVYPNWIMESTLPLWRGPKNPTLCGKYLLAIDTDGTLRSCNADPDTVIGHVGTHRFSDLRFLQRWSAKELADCQDCGFILHCQGGCPYTRKLTYGTYNHKSPFCSAFKELFPLLYKLRDKWNEWNKQK